MRCAPMRRTALAPGRYPRKNVPVGTFRPRGKGGVPGYAGVLATIAPAGRESFT